MGGELRQWCLTTSIKGIPRIIRSRSSFMKTVWTICVLLFISVAIEETVQLARNYLSYPYATSLKEYRTDLTNSVEMPDVTLCNLNPFSGNASSVSDVLTVETYYNMVTNVTACESCTAEEQSIANELRDALLTTEGLYINIGQNNARRLSHTVESFVASCQIIVLDGMQSSFVPCIDAGIELVEYYDYMFYTCFTLHIPENSSVLEYFYGYRLVLHLDDFYHEHHRYLKAQPFVSLTAGVAVMLHERSLPPVPTWRSIMVPSGSFSNLNLRFVRHTRLPPPYGYCSENIGDNLFNNSAYSNLICFALCIQTHVYNNCGCRDDNHYSAFTPRGEHHNSSSWSCLAISSGAEKLQETWACIRLHRKLATGMCFGECPLQCHEVRYNCQVSHSTWPQTTYIEDFYDSYIAGRPYEHRYELLPEVTHRRDGTVNTSHAAHLLKQNFLSVRIGLDDYLMIEYIDVPQLSFSSFLAQLGGTLNLWAGITIVVFVELIEFGFELLWKRPVDRTEPDESEEHT